MLKYIRYFISKYHYHYTYSSKTRGLTLAFARSLLTKQSILSKISSEGDDDIGVALILNVANNTTAIVIYIINFIFNNKVKKE
jgi:hypothetical protein